MAQKSPKNAGAKNASGRDDRLKAALKANLARRKAQARARAAGEDDAGAAGKPVKPER